MHALTYSIIALQVKVITSTFLLALQIEIDNSKKISVKSVNTAQPFAVMKAGLQHSFYSSNLLFFWNLVILSVKCVILLGTGICKGNQELMLSCYWCCSLSALECSLRVWYVDPVDILVSSSQPKWKKKKKFFNS